MGNHGGSERCAWAKPTNALRSGAERHLAGHAESHHADRVFALNSGDLTVLRQCCRLEQRHSHDGAGTKLPIVRQIDFHGSRL